MIEVIWKLQNEEKRNHQNCKLVMQGIRYPKLSISEMEAKIQVIFSYRVSLKAAWDK